MGDLSRSDESVGTGLFSRKPLACFGRDPVFPSMSHFDHSSWRKWLDWKLLPECGEEFQGVTEPEVRTRKDSRGHQFHHAWCSCLRHLCFLGRSATGLTRSRDRTSNVSFQRQFWQGKSLSAMSTSLFAMEFSFSAPGTLWCKSWINLKEVCVLKQSKGANFLSRAKEIRPLNLTLKQVFETRHTVNSVILIRMAEISPGLFSWGALHCCYKAWK